MKPTYDEIKKVVFNTLDFMGPIVTRIKEFCEDNGYKYDLEVENMIFKASQEYHGN